MTRMSARFVGIELGLSTKEVYTIWEKMGLVQKDKFGDWALTNLGRKLGGELSKSNYCPVPTFKFDEIEKAMNEFKKTNKLKKCEEII